MGVTSLMPAAANERIAVSRPEPGPRTSTSTRRTPCSMARLAHCSAASWAANGVDFLEPLNPTLPAEAQANTLPSGSAIDTMVLLNELLMWATPKVMFFRSRLRGRLAPAAGLVVLAIYLRTFFFPATRLLDDGWSVVTADGRLSAHFEHTIAVTDE